MLNAPQINFKKFYLKDISTKQSTNLQRFRKCADRFSIWNLPEYRSSALLAHACELVITTVCVQIDNVSVIRDLLSISVRR